MYYFNHEIKSDSRITRGLGVTLIAILLLATGLTACDSSEDDSGLEKITFNMSWLPQGSMGGVIAAISNGYYEEEGLEVEAIRGFGGIRTVNELDQGMFDFGYGDPLAIILNRRNGGKTKLVGALNNDWPAALCYLNERHEISQPSDLSGLKVGGGQNSPVQVIVPEWLKRNNVDPSSVTMMQLEPSVISASLIEGDIDAGECWFGNSIAVYQKRARDAGMTLGFLRYSDFNLNLYGNGIVTTETMIAEKPDTVRRFLRATYKGYAFASANPEETADIMIGLYPTIDKDITIQQITEMASLVSGGGAMGTLKRDKISQTMSFLAEAYDVDASITVDDIYTTDFLQ